MRTVLFGNSYRPIIGGVETSMVLFRQGLLAAGHDAHVVAPARGNYVDRESNVFRVPALQLPPPLRGSLGLPQKWPVAVTMRGLKPDVIHSQHPFWMGKVAASFAREMRVPLVYTFHTRYDEYAERYVPFAPKLACRYMMGMMRRYMQHCSLVVAPTPSIRAFILHAFALDIPVRVVPTPVELSAYQRAEPQRVRRRLGLGDGKLLIYLGRLDREKGLDLLLGAFARVAAVDDEVRLMLVGRGQSREALGQLAQQLGIGQRVIFVGAVPHDQVPDYVAAADLFCFPSVTETQGLVLLEAMAAGTPVVAVEAPGSMDILFDGGGVLVPARDADLAEGVLGIMADEGLRRELARQAVQVVERYSIQSATARLVAAYQTAIEVGPRGKTRRALEWLSNPLGG